MNKTIAQRLVDIDATWLHETPGPGRTQVVKNARKAYFMLQHPGGGNLSRVEVNALISPELKTAIDALSRPPFGGK